MAFTILFALSFALIVIKCQHTRVMICVFIGMRTLRSVLNQKCSSRYKNKRRVIGKASEMPSQADILEKILVRFHILGWVFFILCIVYIICLSVRRAQKEYTYSHAQLF